MMLLASGCLTTHMGNEETGVVALTSSSSASSAGEGSTYDEIMTTTEDPDRTTGDSAVSAGETDTEDSETESGQTTGIPAMCGDGVLQVEEGEACDEGPGNADDGACTTYCQLAKCGDGVVWAGVEACDDGVNDGKYNGCTPDCTAKAAHCGDGVMQAPEQCDSDQPTDGCLPTCVAAKSCKQIKEAFPEAASDVHTIAPKGPPVKVFCDMVADGGGYTFLKVATAAPLSAKAAETQCAQYGMRLLAPRSMAHLAATVKVAQDDALAPVGAGVKASLKYLQIFGIYPKSDYQACPGKPFNTAGCPQWTTEGSVFWVSAQAPNPPYSNEPGAASCAKCSMTYTWSANGTLLGYQSVVGENQNQDGAESDLFLCQVPDKLP